MKRTKLITFSMLCAIGLLFMGELNIQQLSVFQEEYYSTNFYVDSCKPPASNQEMVRDLEEAAKKYDVDFFVVQYDWKKAYRYETRIIGTPGAINHLKKDGIREGDNKSLFFQTETVKYVPLSTQSDLSKVNVYYLIGEESDLGRLCDFKAELINKYGGGYPKEKDSGIVKLLSVVAIWGLVFGSILLLSCYEVAYMKKENMIHVVMGKSITEMFIRSVAIDSFVCIMVMLVELFLLTKISFVRYKLTWVMALFGIFLLLNVVANAFILRVNYRKDFAGAGSDVRLLVVNYVLKLILSVIVLLIISLNISGIRDAYVTYTQKDFFQQHHQYAFYKMSYGVDAIEEEYDPDDALYREFYSAFQKQSLIYADLSEYCNMMYPFVLVNQNAFIELCEEYPEIMCLKENIDDHKISVLFPENIRKGSKSYKNAMEEMNDGSFFAEEEYGTWNILSYDRGVSVEAIHESGFGYQLSKYRDPIILVDNTDYQYNKCSTGYDAYYNYDILYNITTVDWSLFKKAHELNDDYISITNAKQLYDFVWMHEQRQMLLLVVLLVFTCILEGSLLLLILRLEYQNNAVEMALMKVHGYSLFERNRKLFWSVVCAGSLGVLIAFILSRFAEIGAAPTTMLLVGGVFVVVEVLGIFFNAQSLEKHRVTTILKGERL